MKRIIIILAVFCGIITNAQTLRIDEETFHWEYSLTGGLNTDGWQWDTGFTFFPIQTIGLKLSIGLSGEIKDFSDWSFDWDDDYEYDYNEGSYFDNYAWRFKFIPSLVLRTPEIYRWKSKEVGFYLFAEPGLVLSPGASGSKGAKTVCYDFRGGINIQSYRVVISLGYEFSNFSLYSGHPYNMNGDPLNDNYTTHSGYIGLSYKF